MDPALMCDCDFYYPVSRFLINCLVGLSVISTMGLILFITCNISVFRASLQAAQMQQKSLTEQMEEMPMMKDITGIFQQMSKMKPRKH